MCIDIGTVFILIFVFFALWGMWLNKENEKQEIKSAYWYDVRWHFQNSYSYLFHKLNEHKGEKWVKDALKHLKERDEARVKSLHSIDPSRKETTIRRDISVIEKDIMKYELNERGNND